MSKKMFEKGRKALQVWQDWEKPGDFEESDGGAAGSGGGAGGHVAARRSLLDEESGGSKSSLEFQTFKGKGVFLQCLQYVQS